MKKLIIILMALIAYSTHVFADKVSFTASAPDAVVVGEQFTRQFVCWKKIWYSVMPLVD